MLIEFRVCNYRSFKDEAILSMVASSDKKTLIQNVIEPTGVFKHRLLKSAVIYGANASGKSNLVRAFYFMKDFIMKSVSGDQNTKIDVEPFAFDIKFSNKPSLFEADFIYEGIRYIYGFSADRAKVHEEWLYSFPKGQQVILFERELQGETYVYKFNRPNKKRLNELQINTRGNSLFLTVATQFNVEFAGNVSKWFSSGLRLLPTVDVIFDIQKDIISKMVIGDKRKKSVIVEFLKNADLGISDIEIVEKEKEIDERIFQSIKNLLMDITDSSETKAKLQNEMPEKIKEFIITVQHKSKTSKGGKKVIPLDFSKESDGTKRFFELGGYIIDTINNHYTVLSDELDLRLHPMLSEWFISFFHNYGKNTNAQLIFTTHNTEIMSPHLFRRDQIWFTEKDDEIGSTKLFPLSKYKPRNKENYRKNYLEGRYGAVPILKRFYGFGMEE